MSPDQGKSGFRGYFEWFVHSEATGSMLLLACTVAALLWANSPWAATYFDLLHTYVGVSWGDATFKLSLHHWINDGLMVIFSLSLVSRSNGSWWSASCPPSTRPGCRSRPRSEA